MDPNTDMATLLRARNLKATSTRIEVLNAISAHEKAIPYSEIRNALESFDRVTLYRTLNALIENGIIHKAMTNDNDTFYALCSTNCTSDSHDHKHIHFKCTSCEAVSCVQSDNLIQLSIPGHLITDFEIQASGTCNSCQTLSN